MEEKLLNITEVARYLNLSEQDIRELVDRSDLPAYRIGGILLRFKKEQVENYRRRRDAKFIEEKAAFLQQRKESGSKWPSGERTHTEFKDGAYTFWERLEDFLYYNDFYILSLILLTLILLAVFGY